MDFLTALFLGVLQGLTEFLPVSSTGHLIVAEKMLGVSQERFGLTFDAALHLGTLAAVSVYFWRDIVQIVRLEKNALRTAKLVFVGIIPAAVFGLLFEDLIATVFRSPTVVAVFLLLGSAVFILAERWGRRKRDVASFGVLDAIVVGTAQVFAFFPGMSRSGVTIAAGLGLQLRREDAARFSFLMAIPLFAGAGFKRLLNVDPAILSSNDITFFVVGTVAAALSGYLVIAFLLRYLAGHTLLPFVWYRVVLALFILVFLR